MRITCCWVIRPCSVEEAAIYCGRRTLYHYKDQDGQRYREYDTLCPYHRSIVKAQEIEDYKEED